MLKPKRFIAIFSAAVVVGLVSLALLGSGKAHSEQPKNTASGTKRSPDYQHMSIPELLKAMNIYEIGSEQDAHDFELKSLGGGTVSLKQFRGKTVIINFWTTW